MNAHTIIKTSQDITFNDLGLSPTLLNILEKEGYKIPTPIQAQAIPLLLKGHDLQGIAQTGTGKTAAFALPILNHLLAERKIPAPRTVRALILSPTRELASQIADSFKTYSRGLGLQIATIYGGVKYAQQYKALANGLDILVATPGRLLDHIEQKTIDLRQVEFFVLDEADQMLDLGFVKPIRQIASRMAGKRQNLFFSATMPKEIGSLAAELLTNPQRVEVTPQATTAERVEQSIIYVEQAKKRALLSEMYAEENLSRTLVFTRTKRSADRVAAYLQAGGIEAAAIHGDKNQGQRERALQAFREGRVRALVATDIAARGIDVQDVSHVINYELPFACEAYVHRIGRTARAGKTGISITLCADDERKIVKDIQRITRQIIPTFDRRKDKALALLDEAILASGQTEKPKTPERSRGSSQGRDRDHDRDSQYGNKRPRNRTEKNGSARPGKRDNASKEYAPREYAPREDYIASGDNARVDFSSDTPKRDFKSRDDRGPREDRGAREGRASREDRAPRGDVFRGDAPKRDFKSRDDRGSKHGHARNDAPKNDGYRGDTPKRDYKPARDDRAPKRDYASRDGGDRYDPLKAERPAQKAERPGYKPERINQKPDGANRKPFNKRPFAKSEPRRFEGSDKAAKPQGAKPASDGPSFKRKERRA